MIAGLALAPRRIRGVEHLDDRTLAPGVAIRSLADVRRCNRLFGGTAAVRAGLAPLLQAAAPGTALSLLDVGTGVGDIPDAVRRDAARRGVQVDVTGVEWTGAIAAAARPCCPAVVVSDARALPFAPASFDVVTCSQVVHHLADDDAVAAIAEMHRVARVGVVIGELRRSWFAAAGLWLASWPLGFHPVSRHDGVVSVLRGFAGDELARLVRRATGVWPRIVRTAAFRVTAAWEVR